jgi:hypothetical protein
VIDEFWVIAGFGYEPYHPTLARPGSFISFTIQVSNDSGVVVVRDGKGFVHCATDKIDNFVIGPTLESKQTDLLIARSFAPNCRSRTLPRLPRECAIVNQGAPNCR